MKDYERIIPKWVQMGRNGLPIYNPLGFGLGWVLATITQNLLGWVLGWYVQPKIGYGDV